MIYCRKCGYEMSDDSVFCPKCGTPVAKPEEGKSTDRESGRVKPGCTILHANKAYGVINIEQLRLRGMRSISDTV